MTTAPVLARFHRGFERIGGQIAGTWHRLRGRRTVTAHQQETARETGAMLGLMAEANSAGAAMSDEQRMLLIRAAPGMRAREAVLLGIANRSVVEENELHMIRREMARIEGRDAPAGWVSTGRARVTGFLTPLAAIGGLRLWMVFAGLFALTGGATAIQTARLNHAKDELTEARRTARENYEAAQRWEERAHAYEQATADAAQAARTTAAALEAERQRARRAAARERRRQNEVQSVLTGGDPPAWRLRDDASGESGAAGQPPAAPGDSSGVPGSPR